MKKLISFYIFFVCVFSLFATNSLGNVEFAQGVLLPTGFEDLGRRDFDTAPTPFSTDAMEKLEVASDQILAQYSGKSGKGIDYATRYGIDVLIANTLNKPIREVAKNHDLYVRMLTGKDLENKSFIEAYKDALESVRVKKEIKSLEKKAENSSISLERIAIKTEIKELEQQLIKLGDYSNNRSQLATLVINNALLVALISLVLLAAVVFIVFVFLRKLFRDGL